MRLTFLLIVLVCASFGEALAEGNRPGLDAITQQGQTALELTASIADQRYCKNADPAAIRTLRLKLRLTYRNTGGQDVILYRGSNAPHRQMISASVQNAARNLYISDSSLFVGVEKLPSVARSATLDKNFVVLRPGGTFEVVAVTGQTVLVKGTDEERTDDPNILGTGQYAFQVQVSTFPYPRELARELRELWKMTGELWASDLTSKPTTLRVDRDRKFIDCSK